MSTKRIFFNGFFAAVLAISALASTTTVSPANAHSTTQSAPILEEAKAKNSGGTAAFEAGDSVVLEFSETTNKFPITAANIMTEFGLSNSHTFLDGSGALGSAAWSDNGEKLIIVVSDATSLPTVAVGDTVTVEGSNIKDIDGNVMTGSAIIRGSFISVDDDDDDCASPTMNVSRQGRGSDDDDDDQEDVDDDSDSDEDEDEDEDEDSDDDDDCDDSDNRGHGKFRCGNGLQNGMLYRIEGSPTVFLLANCRLKPFRGIAAFNSRGHKFSEVSVLPTLPPTVTVSDQPVVPAEGTLVKGSDATVWFVASNGKRKGFVSADIFLALGFKFNQVDQISDSDLNTVAKDTDLVDDKTKHPDGALIKCGNSPAVFAVIDDLRFPFASLEAFRSRGHSFDHILNVDCGRFAYREAPAIQ